MRRGRLRRHGGQAHPCNHRWDRRRAYGHGLRSGFEPTRNDASRHGARNPRSQQRGWHRRTHAPLQSTRGHPPRRGGSVRSLVPRPTKSTPPSPGIPLPRRPAVTVGSAHQGAHERPANPRRHRHLPDATGTVDPSAWDHHKPASSRHRRGSLRHFRHGDKRSTCLHHASSGIALAPGFAIPVASLDGRQSDPLLRATRVVEDTDSVSQAATAGDLWPFRAVLADTRRRGYWCRSLRPGCSCRMRRRFRLHS